MSAPNWQKSGAVVVHRASGEEVTILSATDTGWLVQPAEGDAFAAQADELAFREFAVEGVGTVIDPEGEPGYRVRLPDGRVTAYPATSGDPSEANAEADIAAAIADPSPRIAAFVAAATLAVQAMLDARARQQGYDGILSAASYAGESTGVFATEGAAFQAWRSQVWAACYAALAAHNPANPPPAMEAFLAGLPAYVPPS